MKMFAFLVSIVLFVGGLALLGYAFDLPDWWRSVAFLGGLGAISLALILPFHVNEAFD
ncbi:MAG: hypothetical protein ABIR17_09885 [Pseudolysinimonas sp.]|uniref:hypothetical protein n=1 Tax=Pseudolysinimonas sp. TaxID=2680009 RepID=UPI003267EE03